MTVKTFDLDGLIEMLLSGISEAGSQKDFALRIGVSEQYLSDVVRRRRLPGPMLLKALGLRAVRTFASTEETSE